MIDARRVIIRPDQQQLADAVTLIALDDRSRGELVITIRDESTDAYELRLTPDAARALATQLNRLADTLV